MPYYNISDTNSVFWRIFLDKGEPKKIQFEVRQDKDVQKIRATLVGVIGTTLATLNPDRQIDLVRGHQAAELLIRTDGHKIFMVPDLNTDYGKTIWHDRMFLLGKLCTEGLMPASVLADITRDNTPPPTGGGGGKGATPKYRTVGTGF